MRREERRKLRPSQGSNCPQLPAANLLTLSIFQSVSHFSIFHFPLSTLSLPFFLIASCRTKYSHFAPLASPIHLPANQTKLNRVLNYDSSVGQAQVSNQSQILVRNASIAYLLVIENQRQSLTSHLRLKHFRISHSSCPALTLGSFLARLALFFLDPDSRHLK